MVLDWNYAKYRESQLEMRNGILSDDYIMFALCGTGRSGKSYCALGTAIECCIRHAGFRVLYARRTYASLYKTLVLQTLNQLVRNLGELFPDGKVPKDLIKKMPTMQDGLLIFANGSMIQFVGIDGSFDSPRLQDIKGGDYALIILDEANMLETEVYRLALHRLAQKTEGFSNKIVFIYNPDPSLSDWVDNLFDKYENPIDKTILPFGIRSKMGFHRSTFVENQGSLSGKYSEILEFLDEESKQTYIEGKMPDRSGRSFGRVPWASLSPEMKFDKMVIHCDPSRTSNARSCFKAVTLMGLINNQFWVLNAELTQQGTDVMLSSIARFYREAREKYGFAKQIDCWYENRGLPPDFNDMQRQFALHEGLPILIPDKELYGEKQDAIEAIYGMLCERNMLFWNDELRGTKVGDEMEREHTKYDKTRRNQRADLHIDFLDVVMRAARKLGVVGAKTWHIADETPIRSTVREHLSDYSREGY